MGENGKKDVTLQTNCNNVNIIDRKYDYEQLVRV